MWKELHTQHEIDNFMKEIIGFHDRCLCRKESVNVARKHKVYINSSYSATI